jgi:hypothetical protein
MTQRGCGFCWVGYILHQVGTCLHDGPNFPHIGDGRFFEGHAVAFRALCITQESSPLQDLLAITSFSRLISYDIVENCCGCHE